MTDQTSPETEILKPCPFCGSTRVDYIGSPGKGYRVECKACMAQSGWGDYGYQVEAKWNHRFDSAQTAQQPAAWRITDGEGEYEYLTEEPSESSRAWSRRYGREWEPLYALSDTSPTLKAEATND